MSQIVEVKSLRIVQKPIIECTYTLATGSFLSTEPFLLLKALEEQKSKAHENTDSLTTFDEFVLNDGTELT